MACELTNGFALECNDLVGGIKNIYIAQFEDVTLAETDGTTTSITAGTNGDKIFKYALEQGVGNFTETIVSSRENGTHHFEQSVTLSLNKMTAVKRNQIKLLAQNKLMIFCELNQKSALSRTIIVLGHMHGLTLTGGAVGQSGTAFADRVGHELTFSGNQEDPHLFVEDNATIFGADSLSSIVTT